jgi:hypothetical protein
MIVAVAWDAVGAAVLSSAVVSGVIATLLTTRHERKQQFHEQMLATASAFATDFHTALEALEGTDPMYESDDTPVVVVEAKLTENSVPADWTMADHHAAAPPVSTERHASQGQPALWRPTSREQNRADEERERSIQAQRTQPSNGERSRIDPCSRRVRLARHGVKAPPRPTRPAIRPQHGRV